MWWFKFVILALGKWRQEIRSSRSLATIELQASIQALQDILSQDKEDGIVVNGSSN